MRTQQSHDFTASAYRFAADAWAASTSEAQRKFAPILLEWAERASARAMAAIADTQPDLFA
jgi:hypothetical protein